MATAEGAADAFGPRYAPADPTLPEPWKGLVDGSTGVLYYWNPETNITQYEKPTALPPPLPLGPPPSTPKLAPIPSPRVGQPNGIPGQQAHQAAHMSQPVGQDTTSLTQQHSEQMSQTAHQNILQNPQAGQQMGFQTGTLTPQQMRPQMLHQPSQQHQNFPTSEQQIPPLQGSQAPQMYQGGGQLGQPQGYQFPHQQMHYMGYQNNIPQQGQPSLPPQSQHTLPFSHQQDHKASYLQREEADYQQGKHVGFSPSQIHHSGMPSGQNPPAGNNSIQTPQPGQAPPYGGSSFGSQQPASLGQPQQGGMDRGHQQHAPRFQNQLGPVPMHGQPPNVPPAGLKMGYEENPPPRGGNDHYFNTKNDSMTTGPNQPKLATIPMARNLQETRMGGLPHQNISPGLSVVANPVAGPAIYGHASGGPTYPSNALMRPSPAMSSPDAINLSSVDTYRQKHDITVTVCSDLFE